ncbi:MAG TPA: helix-turn-helix transcriptional regulator [Candidatus Coprocola pullicola]|nr:helix-turn-helix transcriptional regulator [Candidatus Coprocola pullicola]
MKIDPKRVVNEEVDFVAIGNRIKSYRLKNNMTQEEMAEYLHMSVPYMSRMESGTSVPRISTIVKIANLFHITPNDLLYDTLKWTDQKQYYEILNLLSGCSEKQQKILFKVLRAVRESICEQEE